MLDVLLCTANTGCPMAVADSIWDPIGKWSLKCCTGERFVRIPLAYILSSPQQAHMLDISPGFPQRAAHWFNTRPVMVTWSIRRRRTPEKRNPAMVQNAGRRNAHGANVWTTTHWEVRRFKEQRGLKQQGKRASFHALTQIFYGMISQILQQLVRWHHVLRGTGP